jgi:(2Fe-2S) ferredoxin
LVELLRREPTTRLVGYACFGQCDFGPNVAFYPEGEWYGGLVGTDAAEQIVRHATNAQSMNAPPLSVPEPDRGEHLKNIADLVRMLERDHAKKRHWWWPF